jgi:hypothetical protein
MPAGTAGCRVITVQPLRGGCSGFVRSEQVLAVGGTEEEPEPGEVLVQQGVSAGRGVGEPGKGCGEGPAARLLPLITVVGGACASAFDRFSLLLPQVPLTQRAQTRASSEELAIRMRRIAGQIGENPRRAAGQRSDVGQVS